MCADYLVNCAVATRNSGGTLDGALVRGRSLDAIAVQFFSNGGFVPGTGGARGVQLIGYFGGEERPQRDII